MVRAVEFIKISFYQKENKVVMLNAIRYIDLFTVSKMLSLYTPNCEQWLTPDGVPNVSKDWK